MAILELTQDNVWEYSTYISDDMAENMNRNFYRGMLSLDGNSEIIGGLVWELENVESRKPTVSNIKFFKADTDECAAELFSAYKANIQNDGVVKSAFVIPVDLGGKEKKHLKDNGFTVRLTEGDDIVVSLKELTQIPLIKKRKPMDNVEPISCMTIRNFRNTIGRCVSMGKKGVCEDLQYLPMAYFDMDVSCYVRGEKDVSGIMLFHQRPSGIVSISLMVAFDQDFSKTLPGMMKFFVDSMQEKHDLDTQVHFSRHNQPSFLLSEKLLPRGFGSPVYTGEREEK